MTVRARQLGIPFEGRAGTHNAITDVDGVAVGHTTIVSGEGKLVVGQGPVRTGVTAILPRADSHEPVFAASYALNGNGEMTGTLWIEESGFLESPVMITNTHSVGTVRDAVISWLLKRERFSPSDDGVFWSLPVVGETYDGILNDINGFHVTAEHTHQALDAATSGPVAEGCVGGGTGMICHEYKGGIGSASRLVEIDGSTYTLGVLVQANYGLRRNLQIAGVPVGQTLTDSGPKIIGLKSYPTTETGSIIVVVATDAPLLPHQLKRIAQRVPVGIARVGGYGGNSSGDIFLAFSTANRQAYSRSSNTQVTMLANDLISDLFEATAWATEEAIVNAMVAAQTTAGINGNTAYALPHDELRELLRQHGRLIH